MNYYEKLVSKIDQSMAAHPRSAVAMDLGSLKVVAIGPNVRAVSRKVSASKLDSSRAVIFQKPSSKVTWVL